MRQKKDAKTSQNTDVSNVHFYCKLHMKLMTTENVMLHLHGKNQCEVRFFKKPMRF